MRRLVVICLALLLIAYAVPSFAMGGGGKNRHSTAKYEQRDSNKGGGNYDSNRGNGDHNSNRGNGNQDSNKGKHKVPEPGTSVLTVSGILGGLLFSGVRKIRSKR